MSEVSNDDRALIECHVLLPYAIYYLEQEALKEKPGFSLVKPIASMTKKAANQERFRVRNELRKRGIRVQSEKGWYRAEVNGVIIEKKMDAEMVKLKAENLLIELIKPLRTS